MEKYPGGGHGHTVALLAEAHAETGLATVRVRVVQIEMVRKTGFAQ